MGLVLTSILCRKSKHDSQFSISVKRMWDLLKCLKTPYSFIPEEFETYALFIMEGSINARNNSCWPTLSIRLSTRLWYSKSCSDLPCCCCHNLMRIPPDVNRESSTQTHDDFDFRFKDFDMWMISGNSVLLFFDWCRLGRSNNVFRSGMLGSLENPQSSGRFSFTLQRVLLLCAWTTTWKARPKRPLLQLYYRKSGAFEVEVSFDFYGNFAPRGHFFSWYENAPSSISAAIFHIFSYSGFFPFKTKWSFFTSI